MELRTLLYSILRDYPIKLTGKKRYMGNQEAHIEALIEALAQTPGNTPLRRMLATAYLDAGDAQKAEQEFTEVLRLDSDDIQSKLGLANAYLAQGKTSLGLVLVEDVLGQQDAPPAAFFTHSHLLVRTGRVEEAVQAYNNGITLDPSLEDEPLATLLGINADPETSDVVDGKMRSSVNEIFVDEPELERSNINFSDVGGMESVKKDIDLKIIAPLKNKELYAQYGKKIGGGILLYGPPGCGKTLLARATAGEIEGSFMSVGLNDVLSMWIGQSEDQLHQLFEQARRNQPSVMFFDEVDALAASRADMRQSAGRHVINQFLAELDGADYDNDGVLILAATNAPWHLDSAFRRPGRFDRVIFVPPPDVEARQAILDILLEGKPMDNIETAAVAKKAKDFSGADLMAVVDRCVEAKLEAAMSSGIPTPITTKDLLKALKKTKAQNQRMVRECAQSCPFRERRRYL